jgi:hypothetical protein
MRVETVDPAGPPPMTTTSGDSRFFGVEGIPAIYRSTSGTVSG